jgi:hypothetical protein
VKTVKGKVVPDFGEQKCCSRECLKKFSQEYIEAIRSNYYSFEDRQARHQYLRNFVDIEAPKRKYVNEESLKLKRQLIRGSWFIMAGKEELKKVNVCVRSIHIVFGISKALTDQARLNESVPAKKQNVGRKHLDGGKTKEEIVQFLQSLQVHPPHYRSERAPHRQFLADPSIDTIQKLFKFFIEQSKKKDLNIKCSKKTFENIFRTEFNIGFSKPYTDECTGCLWYRANKLTKSPQYVRHRFQHKLSNEFYRRTITLKEPTSKALIVSFDLAKIYDCPLVTGGCYYGRQETVYPFGIHIHNTREVHLCVWSESVASRGTNEVSSCLTKVLKPLLEESQSTTLIAFADNCGGQNKSQYNVMFFEMLLCNTSLDRIHVIYTYKGNKGFVPDSDFSRLRTYVNTKIPIETPEALYKAFEDSSKRVIVHKMQREDFLDFSEFSDNNINLLSKVERNKDDERNQFSIQKITQFMLKKSDPLRLFFRYTNFPQEPFKWVNLFRSDSFSSRVQNKKFATLHQAYPGPILLDTAKKKDLRKLYLHVCASEEARTHFASLKFVEPEECDHEESGSDLEEAGPIVVDEESVVSTDVRILFYDRYTPTDAYKQFATTFAERNDIDPAVLLRAPPGVCSPSRALLPPMNPPSLGDLCLPPLQLNFNLDPVPSDPLSSLSSTTTPPQMTHRSSFAALQSFVPQQRWQHYTCNSCQRMISVNHSAPTITIASVPVWKVVCNLCTQVNFIPVPQSQSSTESSTQSSQSSTQHSTQMDHSEQVCNVRSSFLFLPFIA